MWMIAGKRIRSGICHEIAMQKQTISIWKVIIKTSNRHTSCFQMQKNCMDGKCFKNYLQIVLNEKKSI